MLRRNPNYKGPRPHQVEAFLVSNDIGENRAVDLVTSGKADVAAVPPPQSNGGAPGPWQPGGELDRRYGGDAPPATARLLFAPLPSVRFVAFNTRRGLFRDPVLRRAVALALDREGAGRGRRRAAVGLDGRRGDAGRARTRTRRSPGPISPARRRWPAGGAATR